MRFPDICRLQMAWETIRLDRRRGDGGAKAETIISDDLQDMTMNSRNAAKVAKAHIVRAVADRFHTYVMPFSVGTAFRRQSFISLMKVRLWL